MEGQLNIHELLINGFFMQNSIGEFALEKIKIIVDFYNKVLRVNENGLLELKREYQGIKQEFYFIQQHIGEEYIANIIANHIQEIEKILDKDTFMSQRKNKIKYHFK